MKEELIKITKDLISFKTTKGNYEEHLRCLNYIKKYFSEGFVIKEYEKNNIKSLVVSFEDTKTPKLFFIGHIDVVEQSEENQFDAKVEGDKIYGRGAADMKSGIAIMMCVMKSLKDKKPNVALMITSDEEIGGINGTNYLVNEIGYKSDFVIVSEPNQIEDENKINIIHAEKGRAHLKVNIKGKSTHAARPWNGENAIINSAIKIVEIKKCFPEENGNEWVTTFSPHTINGGGIAINMVPDNAEFEADIRYTPELGPDEIREKLSKIEGVDFQIETEFEPTFLNPRDELVKTVGECILKKTGKKPELLKGHGASDLRFFKSSKCLSIGPNGLNWHGKEEFISISSMESLYSSFIELTNRLL